MLDEWDIVLRVVVAAVLGGMVGFDREQAHKPAGVTVHMMVGAGAAVFVGVSALLASDAESLGSQAARIDVSRVIAGVVTGVGFLGAGAIMTRRGEVSGLTTAAGIWTVAAIGAAVAFGFFWLGVAATLLVLVIHGITWLNERRRTAG